MKTLLTTFALIFLVVAGFGVKSYFHEVNLRKALEAKVSEPNQIMGASIDSAEPKPTSAPTPTPVISKPKAPAVDINALNAKLCKSIIDSAKSASENNNKMYFDAWHRWNEDFYGTYDTTEAQEYKRESKNPNASGNPE